jgi:hypothetical protein
VAARNAARRFERRHRHRCVVLKAFFVMERGLAQLLLSVCCPLVSCSAPMFALQQTAAGKFVLYVCTCVHLATVLHFSPVLLVSRARALHVCAYVQHARRH